MAIGGADPRGRCARIRTAAAPARRCRRRARPIVQRQHAHQRRLAGAVGPQNGGVLAAVDAQRTDRLERARRPRRTVASMNSELVPCTDSRPGESTDVGAHVGADLGVQVRELVRAAAGSPPRAKPALLEHASRRRVVRRGKRRAGARRPGCAPTSTMRAERFGRVCRGPTRPAPARSRWTTWIDGLVGEPGAAQDGARSWRSQIEVGPGRPAVPFLRSSTPGTPRVSPTDRCVGHAHDTASPSRDRRRSVSKMASAVGRARAGRKRRCAVVSRTGRGGAQEISIAATRRRTSSPGAARAL